jgi:hypothetical protein
MTRPLKVNGVAVALLEKIADHHRHAQETCQRKTRYPDEYVARGIGGDQMAKGRATSKLYVYKCKWCRGWHLTKQVQASHMAADYYERSK